MSSILLQQALAPEELTHLKQEFPQYGFILQVPGTPLPEEEWKEVEILYGSQLTPEQLNVAQRLRWIHAPSTNLQSLCMREIEETTNLLITNTKDSDVHQMAEYAMGLILAFSKHLFEFQQAQHDPHALWDSPYKSLMWSLKGRTFLQVGLGQVGTAILEKAHQFGMKTWGVARHGSFHPHCQKTFDYSEVNSLLPAVDVLCIAIPRGERVPLLLKRAQLELLKRDSILLILGSDGIVDEKALVEVAAAGKFRGVALDPVVKKSAKSPLWDVPEIFITPEIAPRPEAVDRLEFRQFQHNFRRYIHNDFTGMKNLLRTPAMQY